MLKNTRSVWLAALSLIAACVATGLSYFHLTKFPCEHIACTQGPAYIDRGFPAAISSNYGGISLPGTLGDVAFWFLVLFCFASAVRSVARHTLIADLMRQFSVLFIGFVAGLLLVGLSLLIDSEGYSNFTDNQRSYSVTIASYGWPYAAYKTVSGAPPTLLDQSEQPGLQKDGIIHDAIFWIIIAEIVLVPILLLRNFITAIRTRPKH